MAAIVTDWLTDPSTTIATDGGAPNLAVDILPATGGRGDFVLDDSQLDGPDLLGWSTGTAWQNVVCDVQRVHITRGATRLQGVLTRTEAGRCTFTVVDTERRLDPTINADAVHRGTPVRVRAWGWLPESTGEVESRRNLATNPTARDDLDGWSTVAAGGVVAATRRTGIVDAALPAGVSTAHRATWTTAATAHGGGSIFGTTTSSVFAIPAGFAAMAFGAYARPSVAQRLELVVTFHRESSGALLATYTAPALVHVAGEVLRHTLVVAAPPPAIELSPGVYDATFARVTVRSVAGAGAALWPVSSYLETTAVSAVVHDQPEPYFDGDTADTGVAGVDEGAVRHEWDPFGSPGQGQSLRYLTVVYRGVWSHPLFTGKVDRISASYSREDPPEVTITALDVIGSTLALWTSPGRAEPGIGAGDNLRGRVERVLAEIGKDPGPLISPDSDTEFTATLASSRLSGGWDDITDATDAELGRVWVDAHDRLVIRSRGSELSGPVRGTLSDWHGETVEDADDPVHCCYLDPEVALGPEMLANTAIAARRIPNTGVTPAPVSAVVALYDDESRARHGQATVEQRSLELQTDAQLGPWASAVIVGNTDPELRVDSLRPAPWQAPEAWPAVVETDIGDRWIFRLHPQVGPTVRMTLGILGIEHDITPAEWSTTWIPTDAPTPGESVSGWFELDVSSLDEGDLLAPALHAWVGFAPPP